MSLMLSVIILITALMEAYNTADEVEAYILRGVLKIRQNLQQPRSDYYDIFHIVYDQYFGIVPNFHFCISCNILFDIRCSDMRNHSCFIKHCKNKTKKRNEIPCSSESHSENDYERNSIKTIGEAINKFSVLCSIHGPLDVATASILASSSWKLNDWYVISNIFFRFDTDIHISNE